MCSKVVPVVTDTSTVKELITFLRYAFQAHDFAQVETILMNRENSLKIEVEKLRKDHDILREMRDLLQKKHGFAELERLRLEDELQKSKRECNELNERLTCLSEDHEVLGSRNRRYEKLVEQLLEAEKGKSRIIIGLNEKLEALNREKREIEGKVEELLNAEKEQSRIIVQFSEKIEVLEHEKHEMKEKSRLYKEKFNELKEKVLKLEEEMVKIKGVDVMVIKEGATETEGKVCEEKATYLQNKDPHLTGLVCDNGLLSGKQLTSEARDLDKLTRPSKEVTDRLGSDAITIIDLVESDDDIPTGGTTCVSNVEEINFGENGIASVRSEENKYSSLEKEKFERDCRECHLKNILPKRKRCTSGREHCDNFPIHKLKTECCHEFYDYGKRSLSGPSRSNSAFIGQCEEKGEIEQNPWLPLTKSTVHGVVESSDNSACSEDGSYTEKYVNKEVAGSPSGRSSTWTYAADMLSAFKKDPELLLNAVCALYRQHISSHKSAKGFSFFKGGVFRSLDVLKGTAVAKYLINNDPEHKLSRSISEVKSELPKTLEDCERLATQYYKELFEIYQKELDPYFCPKL